MHKMSLNAIDKIQQFLPGPVAISSQIQ